MCSARPFSGFWDLHLLCPGPFLAQPGTHLINVCRLNSGELSVLETASVLEIDGPDLESSLCLSQLRSASLSLISHVCWGWSMVRVLFLFLLRGPFLLTLLFRHFTVNSIHIAFNQTFFLYCFYREFNTVLQQLWCLIAVVFCLHLD